MYLTLHLILSHFLADFPFQSRKLVKYKQDHFLGVLIHSFTHLAISGLLVLPFADQPRVWWGILIIFLVHNVSDQLKISAQKYFPKWDKFELYVIDQMVHLGTIITVSLYLIGAVEPTISLTSTPLFYNELLISYVLVLTLGTYFFDVSHWTYLNSQAPRPYVRNYQRMLLNALLITVVFGLAYLLK